MFNLILRMRIALFISLFFVILSHAKSHNFFNGKDVTWNKVYNKQELVPGLNKVKYLSDEDSICALLFIPADYVSGEKRPAIIFTRPYTGVKEQTIGLYAEKFSKKGFVTLAFDPRGFGESQGRPQNEDAYEIVEDTKNSVSYISTLEEVDTSNIFNVGICFGSAYAAYATGFDGRVRGLGMISPFLRIMEDHLIIASLLGGPRNAFIKQASAVRQKYYETGEDTYRWVVPTTPIQIAISTPIAVGMRDYYLPGMPGYVPNWKNELSLRTYEAAFSFTPHAYTHMLKSVPFFMAYGSECYTPEDNDRFYDSVKLAPKKKLILEGFGHFDLYYKPECTDTVTNSMSEFFKENMISPVKIKTNSDIANKNTRFTTTYNSAMNLLSINFLNHAIFKEIDVSIYNVAGKMIFTKKEKNINSKKLNYSLNSANGIYVLKLKVDNATTFIRSFLVHK